MDELDTMLTGMDFSEERLERFARGEEDLDFRTPFMMDRSSLKLTRAGENEDGPQQLRVRGLATTSDTDSNGVKVIASALKSLPRNFKARSTLLFNHNYNAPIGRIGRAQYVATDEHTAHVEVEAFVNVDARNQITGMRFVDDIESGTLSKFSFAWATRDGEILMRKQKKKKASEDEDDDILWRYQFGLDHAPEILVRSLEATELSVVSVPADAAAEFAARNLRRSLSSVAQRFAWDKETGMLLPEGSRETSSQAEHSTEVTHTHMMDEEPTGTRAVVEIEEAEVEVPEEASAEAEQEAQVEDNSSAWDEFYDELRSIEAEEDTWAEFSNEIALGGA